MDFVSRRIGNFHYPAIYDVEKIDFEFHDKFLYSVQLKQMAMHTFGSSNDMTLTFADGKTVTLYFTENSGKIISRTKIDTLIGIEHPGIILGNDVWRREWTVHHHAELVYPAAQFTSDYADGEKVYFDTRPVKFTPRVIVARALKLWSQKVSYGLFSQNCQQFVNVAARDEHYSETLNEVTAGAAVAGGVTALLGAIFENENMIKAGLTIAGAGVSGNILNRVL